MKHRNILTTLLILATLTVSAQGVSLHYRYKIITTFFFITVIVVAALILLLFRFIKKIENWND